MNVANHVWHNKNVSELAFKAHIWSSFVPKSFFSIFGTPELCLMSYQNVLYSEVPNKSVTFLILFWEGFFPT